MKKFSKNTRFFSNCFQPTFRVLVIGVSVNNMFISQGKYLRCYILEQKQSSKNTKFISKQRDIINTATFKRPETIQTYKLLPILASNMYTQLVTLPWDFTVLHQICHT